MRRWTEQVRSILARNPTGALPLSVIEEELRREGLPVPKGDGQLVTSLRREPKRFLVLPMRSGPWALTRGWEDAGERGPWIALRDPPEPEWGRGAALRKKLGQGIRAWGEALDRTSPSAVARWIRANLLAQQICTAMATGLSEGQG